MNFRSIAPAFACVLLAATAPSQVIKATLVVRAPVGDLVLNDPLLESLLNERACHDDVQRAVDGVRVQGIGATMPVPHLAGTFQIHVGMDVTHTAPLTDAQRSQLVDAAATHLRHRLDEMLFEQPRGQLQEQMKSLQARHREQTARCAQLRARVELAQQQHEACSHRQAQWAAQLDEAALQVAIEEHARTYLERASKDHTAARDEQRGRIDKLAAEKANVEARIAAMNQQLGRKVNASDANNKDREAEIARLQQNLNDATAAMQSLFRALEEAKERGQDVTRMATAIFEQMPANALALERAIARRDGAKAALASAQVELDKLTQEKADAAMLDAEAEQMAIDVTVTKTMLVEVQGKLARLHPVHFQVLQGQ